MYLKKKFVNDKGRQQQIHCLITYLLMVLFFFVMSRKSCGGLRGMQLCFEVVSSLHVNLAKIAIKKVGDLDTMEL